MKDEGSAKLLLLLGLHRVQTALQIQDPCQCVSPPRFPVYQAFFLSKVRVTLSGVVSPWPGTSADVLTGISGLDVGVSFGDSVHLKRAVANSCSDPREATTLGIGLLASGPRASEAQMQSGNSG